MVLDNLKGLRHLDLKRVTEEERRLASLQARALGVWVWGLGLWKRAGLPASKRVLSVSCVRWWSVKTPVWVWVWWVGTWF